MAIRQDTIVAIRINKSEKILRIANVNDDKYPMCTYPAEPEQVWSETDKEAYSRNVCQFMFLCFRCIYFCVNVLLNISLLHSIRIMAMI